MNKLIPVGITADRSSGQLTVVWSDDHTSVYSFALLRNACPCAECRGGHEKMHTRPEPDLLSIPLIDSRATKIRNVTAVGNYAINLEWDDGHHFGIYNWAYLRALCACPQCQPASSTY